MKKQLAILGILAILISVGLCGCTNNKDIVTITELKLHPENYVNKTITTIGKWSNLTSHPLIQIFNESGAFVLANVPNIDTSILINGAEYYWTGKISRQISGTIYLEVTKVERV